jgi:hypothetical protein
MLKVYNHIRATDTRLEYRVNITLIAFRHEDDMDVSYLKDLPRHLQLGERRFPTAAAYHEAVTDQIGTLGPEDAAEHYASAQRDWHVRGQNGCQFARLVANDAETMGWEYAVCDDTMLTPDLVRELDEQAQSAIARPETQVLSLLFPRVTTANEAVGIIRLLAAHSRFWLERDEMTNDGQALYLRYPVEEDVQAWIMAFAPLDFLPNTRRGPYFELAVRVKPKPEWLFHRLNQDRDLAHLADVPLVMSERYWEDRFESTLRRTRRILGGEPDQVSAAKATLVVPAGYLR